MLFYYAFSPVFLIVTDSGWQSLIQRFRSIDLEFNNKWRKSIKEIIRIVITAIKCMSLKINLKATLTNSKLKVVLCHSIKSPAARICISLVKF